MLGERGVCYRNLESAAIAQFSPASVLFAAGARDLARMDCYRFGPVSLAPAGNSGAASKPLKFSANGCSNAGRLPKGATVAA